MKILLLNFLILATLSSCVSISSFKENSEVVTKNVNPEWDKFKVGQVYASKLSATTYFVAKVMAVEPDLLGLMIYSDVFDSFPSDVDTTTLGYQLGHPETDRIGKFIKNHELVNVEEVTQDQIDGCTLYMGQNHFEQ